MNTLILRRQRKSFITFNTCSDPTTCSGAGTGGQSVSVKEEIKT
jgi:hypothetical protein